MTNEQIRLFAAYFNIVSAGSLLAALVTEPFAWVLAGGSRPWTEAFFVVISLLVSIAFHLAAQAAISRVRNDES